MPEPSTKLPIERHRGMVDVYVLVGLPHWESDVTRIRAAIAATRQQLNEFRQTASPREYSQLSGHVTEAERLLTDSVRKQRYDESLRAAFKDSEGSPVDNSVSARPGTPGRGAGGEGAFDQQAACEPLIQTELTRSGTRESSDGRANDSEVSRLPRQQTRMLASEGNNNDDPSPRLSPPSTEERELLRTGPIVRKERPVAPRSLAVPIVRMTLLERVTSFARPILSRFSDNSMSLWEALHGGHPVRLTLVLLLVLSVAGFWIAQLDWSETFPEHVQRKSVGAETVTAAMSPKPTVESIPGQRIAQARSIPGLESVNGFAPTLNAKLTSIVYTAQSSEGTERHFDLWMARREQVTSSFQKSELIASCTTTDDETDPTLAPNGLELIFVRKSSTGVTQLCRCVRESLGLSFNDPMAIEIPELPASETSLVESPQIVSDGGDLLFRVRSRVSIEAAAEYFICSRRGLDQPFEAARKLPVFVKDARHFVSSDGLRAFIARYHGFQLCSRPTSNAPFSPPAPIERLSALNIGRSEGPYWISPAEDFLFYCSSVPHLGKQQRQLRQVRIR